MKQCKICKNDFKLKRKTQIYCSSVCQKLSLRKRVSTVCSNDSCQKEFEFKPYEQRKYCSKSCSAVVNNKIYPKRNKPICSSCNLKSVTRSQKYCSGCLKILNRERKEREVECLQCKSIFLSKVPYKKYCNKKCSNAYHKKYGKRDLSRSLICPSCQGDKSSNANYCKNCVHEKRSEERINKWLTGVWDGSKSNGHILSGTVRRYLLEKSGYACESCGFDTPHPKDGSSILEIDHINGDGGDHRPENLRVLCPNCHALTDTYKARNIGKGRKHYYLRIDKKSIDSISL